MALDNKLFVECIVGNGKFVRLATNLTIFDVFLRLALGGIYESVVHFSAIRATIFSSLGFPFMFH